MLFFRGKTLDFDPDKCVRCGACFASCGHGALSCNPECGDREPFVTINRERCVLCQKCVKVCPVSELPLHPLIGDDIEQLEHICLASSKDEQVRFNASSGGAARELAYAALQSGFVDAVYGVRRLPSAPFYEGAYFVEPDDVLQMANSVYHAFPFAAGLKKRLDGRLIKRLLFIGTNCQMQAGANFYKGTSTELIRVAILCKQQKTHDFVTYIRREMGDPDDLEAAIEYRGKGWPGVVRSNAKEKPSEFYTVPFGMELWRVPGCKLCANLFGWKSDLVLLDPWGIGADDRSGLNLVLIRTDTGQRLWNMGRSRIADSDQITGAGGTPNSKSRPLTVADVKTAIDWWRYRRTKVDSIPYYLGQERNWMRKLGYAFLDWVRTFNGWFFLRFKNRALRNILMRFWGKSSKAILMIVGKR